MIDGGFVTCGACGTRHLKWTLENEIVVCGCGATLFVRVTNVQKDFFDVDISLWLKDNPAVQKEYERSHFWDDKPVFHRE